MNRSRLGAAAFAAALWLAGGCSSKTTTAPETIEGKTPAEYREAAERGVVDSVPATPKASSKKK